MTHDELLAGIPVFQLLDDPAPMVEVARRVRLRLVCERVFGPDPVGGPVMLARQMLEGEQAAT